MTQQLPGVSNSRFWSLRAKSTWLNGREYPLIPNKAQKAIIIGRAKTCDIAFPGTQLSKQHVSVNIDNNSLHITDLGSKLGIFVNNERVTETRLKPGDIVRFDVLKFEILAPHSPSASAVTKTDEKPRKKQDSNSKTAIEKQQNKLRLSSTVKNPNIESTSAKVLKPRKALKPNHDRPYLRDNSEVDENRMNTLADRLDETTYQPKSQERTLGLIILLVFFVTMALLIGFYLD